MPRNPPWHETPIASNPLWVRGIFQTLKIMHRSLQDHRLCKPLLVF